MIPWAANWTACWEEPHWRSMVVAGTSSGSPAASQALRATFTDCSPIWDTQPMITSSTSPWSIPDRPTRARRPHAHRPTQSPRVPRREVDGTERPGRLPRLDVFRSRGGHGAKQGQCDALPRLFQFEHHSAVGGRPSRADDGAGVPGGEGIALAPNVHAGSREPGSGEGGA